jgi:hypothetical protein
VSKKLVPALTADSKLSQSNSRGGSRSGSLSLPVARSSELTRSAHGTDELPEELFREMIRRGVSKVS